MKIKQLKKELKELSLKIRTAKSVYKEGQRKSDYKIYHNWCFENDNFIIGWNQQKFPKEIKDLSWTYRHKHIAYCLLRGKEYEQVESKVKEGNEPSWTFIDSFMNEYREVAEDVPV